MRALRESLATSQFTRRPSVPARSTTANAPPTRKISTTTEPASSIALWNGNERGERPHRRRIDVRVGAGDHHRPSRARVLVPLELSRRKEVGEDSSQEDADDEESERMGEPEPVMDRLISGGSVG